MKIDYSLFGPATQAKIALWREGCINGTITNEELQKAISNLRADRTAAVQAAATKARNSTSGSTTRKRAVKVAVSEEEVANLMKGF